MKAKDRSKAAKKLAEMTPDEIAQAMVVGDGHDADVARARLAGTIAVVREAEKKGLDPSGPLRSNR